MNSSNHRLRIDLVIRIAFYQYISQTNCSQKVLLFTGHTQTHTLITTVIWNIYDLTNGALRQSAAKAREPSGTRDHLRARNPLLKYSSATCGNMGGLLFLYGLFLWSLPLGTHGEDPLSVTCNQQTSLEVKRTKSQPRSRGRKCVVSLDRFSASVWNCCWCARMPFKNEISRRRQLSDKWSTSWWCRREIGR